MAEEGSKVILNVYDLSGGLAKQLSTSFLGKAIEGIWHTGLVVYGNEYFFGGGIQHEPAGQTMYGTPLKVIDLGVTHIPKDVFESYLQEISPRYTAETYNLMAHNCNNFSNEVANFLVSKGIPDYILQLPNEVLSSPMGPLILPMIQNLETTLKAGAVPQGPQFVPMAVPPTAEIQTQLNPSSEETKDKDNDTKPTVVDPLGDARNKIQEEIATEFAAIMSTRSLRASEAAALATRKVMQRYGHMDEIGTLPQS
ncbi:hypothetical protein ACFE04_013469 [Oxalis oulophora]